MSPALYRRTSDRYARQAARYVRPVRAFLSPSARAQRPRSLPVGYRWFRLRAIGPLPEPLASLAIAEASTSGLPFDLGVVAGGTVLTPEVVDALVECERTSTPTLLVATAGEHLGSDLAAVCTTIGTTEAGLHAAATAQAGAERSTLLPDSDERRTWLRSLVALR